MVIMKKKEESDLSIFYKNINSSYIISIDLLFFLNLTYKLYSISLKNIIGPFQKDDISYVGNSFNSKETKVVANFFGSTTC